MTRPASNRLLYATIFILWFTEFVQAGMTAFAAAPLMGERAMGPEEFSLVAAVYASLAILAISQQRWWVERVGGQRFMQGAAVVAVAGALVCAARHDFAGLLGGPRTDGAGRRRVLHGQPHDHPAPADKAAAFCGHSLPCHGPGHRHCSVALAGRHGGGRRQHVGPVWFGLMAALGAGGGTQIALAQAVQKAAQQAALLASDDVSLVAVLGLVGMLVVGAQRVCR